MKVKYLKDDMLYNLKNNNKKVYELLRIDDNFISLMNFVNEDSFGESLIEFDAFDFIYNSENPIESDFENAKMIYEKFKHLTESQAIDERFWTGLTFQIGKNYLLYRWGLENVKKVQYRWFFYTKHRRSLFYHGLSRLWWYAHLTYDSNREDPYEITKFTFQYPEAILGSLIYRNFSSSKHVRFSIFYALLKYEKSGGLISSSKVNEVYKSLSYLAGITILDLIPSDRLEQEILFQLYEL